MLSLAAAMLFCALPFLLTEADPRRAVLTAGDGLICFLPYMALLREQLAGGELPLWNPYYYGGFPFAADPQSAVWFPPNLLLALFPPIIGFNVRVALSLGIALWGMLTLLRHVRLGWAAAIVGAVSFAFGGSLMARVAIQPPMVATIGLLPWLFLTQRLRIQPIRRVALGGLVAGAMLLAGHPQVALYGLTGFAFIQGWSAIRRSSIPGSPAAARAAAFLRGLLPLLAIVILGGLVAAVQILPTQELTATSGRPAITREFFFSFSLTRQAWILAIYPYFFGDYKWLTWSGLGYAGPPNLNELSHYGGLLPLALCVVFLAVGLLQGALRLSLPRWEQQHIPRGLRRVTLMLRPWLVLLLLAYLAAIGPSTPIGSLLYHLPPFNLFRVPARFLMVAQFAVAMIAAIGLDAILRGERGRAWLRWLGVAALLIGAALLSAPWIWALTERGVYLPALLSRLGLDPVQHGVADLFMRNPGLSITAAIGGVLLTCSAATALWRWRGGRTLLAGWAVVAWVIVDVGVHSLFLLPRPEPVADRLKDEMETELLSGPGRILVGVPYDGFWNNEYRLLLPGLNILAGMESLGGHAPLAPGRLQERLGISVIGSVEPPLAMLNGGGTRLAALGVGRVILSSADSRTLAEDERLRPIQPGPDSGVISTWIAVPDSAATIELAGGAVSLRSSDSGRLAEVRTPVAHVGTTGFLKVVVTARHLGGGSDMPLHLDLFGSDFDHPACDGLLDASQLSNEARDFAWLFPIGAMPTDTQLRLFTRSGSGIAVDRVAWQRLPEVTTPAGLHSRGVVWGDFLKWEVVGWSPVRVTDGAGHTIPTEVLDNPAANGYRRRWVEFVLPADAWATEEIRIHPMIRHERGWRAWRWDASGQRLERLEVGRSEHMNLEIKLPIGGLASRPDGRTLVALELSYLPSSFLRGAGISLLALLTIAALLGWTRFRLPVTALRTGFLGNNNSRTRSPRQGRIE